MGKKRIVVMVLVISGTALAALLIFSKFYLAKEAEGISYQQGSLSKNNEFIAYVGREEGSQTLILANEKTGESKELLRAKEGNLIKDPNINAEARKVTYLSNSSEKSSLYSIEIDSYKIEKLMTVKSPVPETAEGEGKIYYVKGNYQHTDQDGNPFHYYDLYSYDIKTKKTERLSKKDAFSIFSLTYDKDSEKLYFVMNYSDSGNPFDASQSIYEMSLQDNSIKKLDAGMRDVFEITLSPTEEELIFTGIANPKTNSSYKYELFSLNLNTYQTKRLTFLESFAADPVFTKSGQEIYFAFNDKFPGRDYSNFNLYKLNRETLTVEKTGLQFKMD